MSELGDFFRKGSKLLSTAKGVAVAAPTAGAVFSAAIPAVGLAVPAGPAILATAILVGGGYAGYKLGGLVIGGIVDFFDGPPEH